MGVGQSPHKQRAAGVASGLTLTVVFCRTSLSIENTLFKNMGLPAMSSRLALNSGSPCLSLPSSRITGICGELLHLSLVLEIAQ